MAAYAFNDDVKMMKKLKNIMSIFATRSSFFTNESTKLAGGRGHEI